MLMITMLLAMILSLPMCVLTAECLASLLPGRVRQRDSDAPPMTVLMPAHNEASGIVTSIRQVQAQLRHCDRLIVIADNCTDGTAQLARDADAEVIERNDAALRGKSFALAFARDWLIREGAAPDVVVIVDADCVPAAGALQRLAATATRRNAAVQGLYLLTTVIGASIRVRFSAFAFRVKNYVRQRGLRRLGAPALLQGSGMAFPWAIFRDAPLESSSLVEDLELGLELFLMKNEVSFDEKALFTSAACSQAALTSQRTRWEHGYCATMCAYGPRLLFAGLMGRPRALLLALDILIPPLSLLGLIMLTALGLVSTLSIEAPVQLMLWSITGSLLALAMIWLRWGRDLISASDLLRLPNYVLWKLPIYYRLVFRPQRAWIRTSRH